MCYAGALIWYNGTSALSPSRKADRRACCISKVNIPNAFQIFENALVAITCRCPKIHYLHEQ
jgi:hypothetical protein